MLEAVVVTRRAAGAAAVAGSRGGARELQLGAPRGTAELLARKEKLAGPGEAPSHASTDSELAWLEMEKARAAASPALIKHRS